MCTWSNDERSIRSIVGYLVASKPLAERSPGLHGATMDELCDRRLGVVWKVHPFG